MGEQRHFRRRTISKQFRSIALSCLPGLNADPAYWQFFGYLLFGATCDEHSGKLLIGQPRLAKATGQNTNNFIAQSFLQRFQRDVLGVGTFAWTGYSKIGEKCRRVNRCVWPAALAAAIPSETAKEWHGGGRCYLDGSGFSAATTKKERSTERHSAELRPGLCVDALEIQAYMNGLDPHLFTKTVAKHYDRALAVAYAVPNPISRSNQLRMLPGIEDQPQPFYGASEEGNTVRLFACESIPNLQGDVRRALTADWAEADLKSCQLAICASKWQVPLILRFLETRRSIWEYLGGRLVLLQGSSVLC